jgi:hypothetical protein
MAITEIYVDPSIAGDSGAGTSADPYGDLEYAIVQSTFDVTNGTRVNIKAGTDEVLVAPIDTALADTSVSIAWAPTIDLPLVFQGYTAVAGDGGIGGISGGGSVSVFGAATLDFSVLADLHMHTCGSATIVDIDNSNAVLRCEIDNTSGSGLLFDNYSIASGLYVHNCGALGISAITGVSCFHSYFKNGTNKFSNAISLTGTGALVHRCIVDIDGVSDGIALGNSGVATHNSVYSNAGTGQGIRLSGSVITQNMSNNLVEGFSGSGGIGIQMIADTCFFLTGNGVFNCETAYDLDAFALEMAAIAGGDNETLSVSPFSDAANGDFNPVDTGNVKEGALPQAWTN